MSEYLRVENVFDKDYISSIKVNDGNARIFDSAAGRNYMVGVIASYRFSSIVVTPKAVII